MSSETKQILTTDGIPLEVSLKKAERKNKIKAFLLVAPLLLFLIITYIFPSPLSFSNQIFDISIMQRHLASIPCRSLIQQMF